ncbi:MAG TPA: hypothetical protein VNO55_02730 [Polyangia bacterium]|nr:hypothetical protein [Polyangia bacterium]
MPTNGRAAAFASFMALLVMSGAARGQSPGPSQALCPTACPADQTCINGVCMVPAAGPASQALPIAPSAPVAVWPTPAVSSTPPPAPAASSPAGVVVAPPARSPLSLLPYLGVHSAVGDAGKSLDMGLHAGIFVGGRINDWVSLNGEVGLDWFNPSGTPAGIDVTDRMYTLAFSPLVQAPVGVGRFVIGPTLGGFVTRAELTRDQSLTGVSSTANFTAHGWLVGANAGFFFPVSSKIDLGVLLGFRSHSATESCEKVDNQLESCRSDNLGSSLKMFNTTLAALF